jgi:hypothetical protein
VTREQREALAVLRRAARETRDAHPVVERARDWELMLEQVNGLERIWRQLEARGPEQKSE